MTTLDPRSLDPRPFGSGGLPETVVHYDEPPAKPPPMLAVGALAWVRNNLFKSVGDTILTFVAGFVIISLISGLITWAIGSANWLVINRNLRLFMLGTYPPDQAWRGGLIALIAAFAFGYTLYAYTRMRLRGWIVTAIIMAVLALLPVAFRLFTAPLPMVLAAGQREIASGTITENPQADLAFIGRAGETVTLRLADTASGDVPLAGEVGFADRASQALINSAINRLATQDELALLESQRDTSLLTSAQRADVERNITRITIPEPVTGVYAVNTEPVDVQLLDADGQVLISQTLTPADDASAPGELSFVLPADDWYIVRKTMAPGDAVGLLQTTGIYPLVERDLGGGRIYYSRVTDDFEIRTRQPRFDGNNVAAAFLIDNQYIGTRSLNDYLRLHLSTFLDLIMRAFIPLTAVAFVGYLAGSATTRLSVTAKRRSNSAPSVVQGAALRESARDMVPYLWVIVLMMLFTLSAGRAGFGALDTGVLIARFVWVGFMFFVGALAAKPSARGTYGIPLIGLGLVIGLALAAYAEGLFKGLSLGVVISVGIWLVVGYMAARRGAGSAPRLTMRDAVLGVIVAFLLIIIATVGPSLLGAQSNLLPPVDTRRWGGFLLTMILTVVAIVASFPLGILLALGRRSDLPVVKWACTVYIELVRGVPLITILFMAQLLVPLIGAGIGDVDNIIRAIVGLTLFSAAYLAENVRGGLQSIPPGQEEAAEALGLQGWQTTVLVLLPQALRAVIPALVGQCIALFKDTSLVALVGLTDLTGIARAAIAQTEFIGLQTEVYVFISVIYFIFSYLMAYISRRIEASGSGSARRI